MYSCLVAKNNEDKKMQSHRDHHIHELTTATIVDLLEKSAWKNDNQTITSANTNDDDLEEPDEQWIAINENTSGINAFSDITFDPHVKRILDVGGGKFDCNQNYMKHQKNIDLLVWDPYNRSQSHNDQIQAEVSKNKVDAVTSMSVLNVIPEADVRLAHINTLKAALVIGGKAYFKVWSGAQPLKGTYLPSATDAAYQANAYADRFLREIEIVFGMGNVKLDRNIPNLIVAVKTRESHTSEHDITRIKKKSEKECTLLSCIKEKSISHLYSRSNIFKLFSTHSSFIKKMEDDFIKNNRHANENLQHEYDKRYGLVLYKKDNGMRAPT